MITETNKQPRTDRMEKISVKLKNVNWPGMPNVYVESGRIWAYDSIAGRDVPVEHLMSIGQKKRILAKFA